MVDVDDDVAAVEDDAIVVVGDDPIVIVGDDPIVIVGVAVRVPGANDAEEFWVNLACGHERPSTNESGLFASELSAAELSAAELFEAELFGLTDREAEQCQPQTRLFLELAHCAIENAGYDTAKLGAGVGVFAAISSPTVDRCDDVAATASKALDLHGPTVTMTTAGSSALVALSMAGRSLRAGDCDLAVVGGVTVEDPGGTGGGGVVVVKRFSDAVADHDQIRAVIRGVAVDNDGAATLGRDLPGPAAVVAEAMALAGVRPEDISHVEAVGAGLDLAEVVQTATLAEAYTRLAGSRLPEGYCGIGSVEGNGGQLGSIVGLIGLIKTVLALEHEQLPASLNSSTTESRLELASTPFRVQDRLAPWPRDPQRPRRAAVAAAGRDGSSVHVVVEEAPAQGHTAHTEQPRAVVWSGLTVAAELATRRRLARFFVQRGEECFADAVGTLQHGRAAHPVRAAAVCTGSLDAAVALGAVGSARVITLGRPVRTPRPVSLLLSGQGSAHAARNLYREIPAFARLLDRWLDLLDGPDLPLRDHWRGGDGGPRAAGGPELDTALIFAVQAALAQVWCEAGVRPAALLGAGIGELAAAAVAGVFAPADAASMVRARVLAARNGASGAAGEGLAAKPPAKLPAMALYLASTGRAVTPAEAGDLAFWTPPVLAPDRGAEAVNALLDSGEGVMVGVGSGPWLTELARRHPLSREATFAVVAPDRADTVSLLTVAAHLWSEGHDISWESLGQEPLRRRTPLPRYPYRRRRSDAPEPPLAVAVQFGGSRSTSRASATPVGLELMMPPGSGPVVVAIPYAGASGRAFRAVRRWIPPEWGLAAVDLPGHGTRMGEACLRDVDAVVNELLRALPALPTQRLVLLGYSLGGWLAYEVAARLTDTGMPAEGLVVCGSRAPHTGVGHPPVAHLPPGGPFLRAAVHLGIAAPEMLEFPELADSFGAVLQADLFLLESFRFRLRRPRLAAPVCVVGMSEDWLVPEPSLRAWDDLCRRPPLQLRVDGGHLALHEREQEFGEAIGAALDQLQGLGLRRAHALCEEGVP